MTSTGVRGCIRRWSTTSAAALGTYCLVAFLVFGLRLLVEPGRQYVGFGSDPEIFIWSFAWWPHAILHGQNPFFTHEIWAPTGVDLAWATSVPGLALLFSPLTLLLGPFASYDVAATLLPAFGAWTAFLLCRHLTRTFWPSLVGGYLFGFSSYELGQQEGHPHMSAVFLVPVVALLIVRYVEGGLDGRSLAVRLGPVFAFQVLLSTELAFTLGLAVLVGIALGIWRVPERRARLRSLLAPLAAGAALAAALLAPFLYYAVTGYQSGSLNDPGAYVTDLLNWVVPTKLSLASLGWAEPIARHFPGNDAERGAYLGLPALVVAFAYLRGPRTPPASFLLAALLTAVVASLGDHLIVDGQRRSIPLPWALVIGRPLFDNALPERFALYAILVVSVVVALWTARRRPGVLRFAAPFLAVAAVLPNPAAGAWATSFEVPAFFGSAYRSCLGPNETVLPFPLSTPGLPMLWQVTADFRFRMAGGEIAPQPPASFLDSTAARAVAYGKPIPPSQAGLIRDYIREKGVTTVVVDAADAGKWSYAMNTIATPQLVGGVFVYRVGSPVRSC
ncbi:MAG TPA: hypothetical protein VG265_14555 [Gaiellaceae bacterium]|nr:hypothetical protein [Gaiellaceae bacterium]